MDEADVLVDATCSWMLRARGCCLVPHCTLSHHYLCKCSSLVQQPWPWGAQSIVIGHAVCHD